MLTLCCFCGHIDSLNPPSRGVKTERSPTVYQAPPPPNSAGHDGMLWSCLCSFLYLIAACRHVSCYMSRAVRPKHTRVHSNKEKETHAHPHPTGETKHRLMMAPLRKPHSRAKRYETPEIHEIQPARPRRRKSCPGASSDAAINPATDPPIPKCTPSGAATSLYAFPGIGLIATETHADKVHSESSADSPRPHDRPAWAGRRRIPASRN